MLHENVTLNLSLCHRMVYRTTGSRPDSAATKARKILHFCRSVLAFIVI